MINVALSPSSRRQRRRLQERSLTLICTAMIGAAVLGRLASQPATEPPATSDIRADAALPAANAAVVSDQNAWLLDPSPLLRTGTPSLMMAPLAAALRPTQTDIVRTDEIVALVQQTPRDRRLMAQVEVVERLQTVPLPIRRPTALRTPIETIKLAARPLTPRVQAATRTDAQAERSFFETVFGEQPAPSPALAYAPTQSTAIESGPRRLLGPAPSARAEGATAVYDITARTVTLPSGEQLEAHSGLGAAMDNPRHVHLRMRGSTPPGVYDLTEREALFHGVRAIRLNPVGGSAAIHGRDGILAHTYMLGPKGASNGCVSFRDYNRFLQAYLRGDVRRLAVVAGNGSDALPSVVGRAFKRLAGAE